MVETNVSPLGLDADEVPRAKRSSQPLSLSLYRFIKEKKKRAALPNVRLFPSVPCMIKNKST